MPAFQIHYNELVLLSYAVHIQLYKHELPNLVSAPYLPVLSDRRCFDSLQSHASYFRLGDDQCSRAT